jgi:hypothetical protein
MRARRHFFRVALILSCAGSTLSIAAALEPPPAGAKTMTDTAGPDTAGRADLPFSQGLRFSTLDAYLAHRRKLGTMDRPFYEEIAPGLYKLRGGSPMAVPVPDVTLTRQELMEKYGFDR